MVKKSMQFVATLGVSIIVLLGLQIIVGIALALSYTPSFQGGHASVQAMHDHPALGLLQRFHYWASAVTIVVGLYAIWLSLWHASYRDGGQSRFICLFVAVLLTLAFQITGNLLPLDRHGVQTAAIEGGIASRIPVLGPDISRMMLNGPRVSNGTVALWFNLHRFVLPAASIAVAVIGFLAHLRRPTLEPRWSVVAALVFAPFLIAFAVDSPLGSKATTADATSFTALASWYVAPMHGLLVAADTYIPGGGWISAVLVPTIMVACVIGFAVKEVDVKYSRWLAGTCALILGGATLGFGTKTAPLVGKRDPAKSSNLARKSKDLQDKISAKRGRTLFNQQCAVCHGQDGVGAAAGPNLETLYRSHPAAAYYIEYIRNPKSVRPGSTMPPFPGLKEEELRNLAEFLRFPTLNVK